MTTTRSAPLSSSDASEARNSGAESEKSVDGLWSSRRGRSPTSVKAHGADDPGVTSLKLSDVKKGWTHQLWRTARAGQSSVSRSTRIAADKRAGGDKLQFENPFRSGAKCRRRAAPGGGPQSPSLVRSAA